MIEVESKIFVENPREIRKKARALGKYSGVELKVDDYFTIENLRSYPEESIRIRKVDGHYIANFKQRLSYEHGVHAKKEIEYTVKDIGCFMRMMKSFGFKRWLRKEKRCEIYGIKKNFHIELNRVKRLGWFVEIEYLVRKMSEIKHARREVGEVIKKLGLREEDAIKKGYTKMLWEKRHK